MARRMQGPDVVGCAKAALDTCIITGSSARSRWQYYNAGVGTNDPLNFAQHQVRDLVYVQTATDRLADAVE